MPKQPDASRPVMDEGLLLTNTSSSSSSPPRDRCRLAFLILYLQGVGCLFPWNAFITKTDYYALAFRDSPYGDTFESIITSSFTCLGLLTIISLQHVQHLSSPRTRIVGALTLQLCIFLVIFGLSAAPLGLPAEQMVDSLRRDATTTFTVTVVCVALAGVAQAVLTGSLFSYAVVYDRPTYLQAISGGMGVAGLSVSLGGLVTSLPQTQTQCSQPNATSADGLEVDRATVAGAAVYFGLSCLVLLLCLLSFLWLDRLPFTRECQQLAREREAGEAGREAAGAGGAALDDVAADLAGSDGAANDESAGARLCSRVPPAGGARRPPPLVLRVWMWALSLTLIYTVTLGLFPSLTSTIVSSAVGAQWCTWRGMFVPLGFILFNLGDTIGRNLPGIFRSARLVLLLVALRVVFIPLFMMCNVQTTASIFAPPPLAADAWPLAIMLCFAVSNGWLTTCALMHAPEAVPPSERGQVGSLMICFLNGGLFVGSALSFVVKAAMCGGCNPFLASDGNSTR